MKSSLFLVATGALLASAAPCVIVTDWVVEVVMVTVTAGQGQAAVPTEGCVDTKATCTPKYTPPPAPVVTTSQTPPPPPPPTTTSTPSAGPPSGGLGNYEQTMLRQHNLHRANHSAPALTWDSTLAQYAANTGNTCVFRHNMTQGGGGYGQNLAAWFSSGDINDLMVTMGARAVTTQWYNSEFNVFQYYGEANPNFGGWGHFSQVVWKSSTKVGCATIKCGAGTVLSGPGWYTVCNYDPPGNFRGAYADNILRPRGDATITI